MHEPTMSTPREFSEGDPLCSHSILPIMSASALNEHKREQFLLGQLIYKAP